MRIVHVADFVTDVLGYQELQLARWNARHGHDVVVLTSCLNPPHSDYGAAFEPLLGPRRLTVGDEILSGVEVRRLEVAVERRTRVILRGLHRELRRFGPDAILVHGSMSPTTLACARYARRSAVPLFADNHMEFSVQDKSPVGRVAYAGMRTIMRQYLAPRVEGFFGVAEDCSRFLVEALAAPEQKVALLPLGVDTELFRYSSDAAQRRRQEVGIPVGARVVMQTGKLSADKDPITLARAVSGLMLENPDVWTVFLGNGPEQTIEELRAAIGPSGQERLRVLPMVPFLDLPEYLSMADVVVYPGGTSLSSLEAASCERAVIMNDLPNSRWRSGLGLGRTFRTHNPDSLRREVGSILADREGREKMGRSARKLVEDQFSYDRVAALLEEQMAAAVLGTHR